MNRIVSILISLVLFPIIVFAQPPIELVRTYDFENVVYFNDIYAVSNGDFVVSGNSLTGRNAGDMMVVGRLDSGGGLIWSWTNGDRVIDYTAVTIIETENGSFLTGGHSYDHETRIWRFIVALIDSEGETIWTRDYGIGRCYGVIELKSGEYVLAGNSDDEAQLILINDEGEVIWQETYAHDNEDDARFVAIRETDGGVVASGRFAVWVVKVDLENGEMIWSRSHNANARYCNDMTSTVDGGFVMALSRVGGGSNFGLFKVNEDGDEVWNRSYELEGNNNANFASGVTRLDDGGFAIVGRRIDEDDRPVVVRTNSRGNERWIQTYYLEEWEEFEGPGFFYGVTRGLDGSIIAAGWAVMTDENQRFHALLMKLEQYIPEPVIFDWSPEDTVFSVLPGDTITFMAVARDQQGDELSNLWIVNEDTLGTDTTETIIFEELGEYYVQCQISDEENTATIGWRVTAEEFYLDRFSPDSLVWTIQRNTEVEFSLGVRVIDGFEPEYSWTITDREHRPNDIGNEAEVTYNFDLAGNFSIEGIVFLDQVEHLVRWQIEVNSVLWWWRPHETEFTVEIDEPIEFTALPFNPDSDSLSYLWLVDGEDDGDVEDGIFARFNDVGEHHVTAIVHDGAEVDTVLWTVTVNPNAVDKEFTSLLPTEVTLYPSSPNPFNSMTSIRYFLPSSANVRLTVYDSAGRSIKTLNDGWTATGEHRDTLYGTDLPTGVYVVRLEVGGAIHTMKVVLLK